MSSEPQHIGSANADDPKRLVRRTADYAFSLDAIVLAGTHQNAKRLIYGRNKAFLKVGEQKLILYVVKALLESKSIGEVFVVGPVEELMKELSGLSSRVRVIAQRGKMLTNCWAGIEAAEDFRRNDPDVPVSQRPLVIISCDLPLVTTRSIDDFVSRCAYEDSLSDQGYGMLVGVVDEPGVKPFHSTPGKQGIERPFVELAIGRLRLANIYVGRPRNLSRQEFLQTGFSYRKAVDWRNVVALIFSFLRTKGGWAAAWMSVRMQLALMLSKGRGRWYKRLKKGNTQARVEKCISEVLGGPTKIVVTPFGGLSLDVDDQDDLRILDARYKDWAEITATVDTQS